VNFRHTRLKGLLTVERDPLSSLAAAPARAARRGQMESEELRCMLVVETKVDRAPSGKARISWQ